MSDSKIPIRSHESPLDSSQPGSGTIIISTTTRVTEQAAEERIESGIPHQATDTLGDWHAAGLEQCSRCGVAQDAETAYRKMLKNGKLYRYHICRDCEIEIVRTRRFSRVIAQSPYPKRIEDQ